MNTDKEQLFAKLAMKLWDDDCIDKQNYDNNYDDFESDFLNICKQHFSGILLIYGDIIK